MQFAVKHTKEFGMRLGEIVLGKYKSATPSVLVSSSRLAVPHTTLDRLRKIILPDGSNHPRVAGIIAYVDTLFENPKLVKSNEMPGVHEFAGLKEFPVFLALESGLDAGLDKLKNGKDFITVSNTSGACKVAVKDFSQLCNRMKPDAMILPHDRIAAVVPPKHVVRAAKRTAEYATIFQEEFKSPAQLIEPSFEGVPCSGMFGKMLINLDEGNVVERLAKSDAKHALRYAAGMFSPVQVVSLVKAGVDLVDTSYVDHITTQNQSLLIDFSSVTLGEFKLLSLGEESYFEDLTLLDASCGCLACSAGVPRSYIHHLIKTGEMLATAHLQAHNMHQYIRLLEQLRMAE